MKSPKASRGHVSVSDAKDSMKRPVKLDPIRKSGKDRYAIYGGLDEDDDIDTGYRKKESILDYYEEEEAD